MGVLLETYGKITEHKNYVSDGETTGGGFPGWVGNIAGSLRANNVDYTQGLAFFLILSGY